MNGVNILGQTASTKVKFLKLMFWFAGVWKEFGLVRSIRNDNKSQGKAGLAPRVILVDLSNGNHSMKPT